MSRGENLPFARGETWLNGAAYDSTNVPTPNWLGREFVVDVNAPDGQAAGDPSGREVRLRVVQNLSGANLKPGRLVHYTPTVSTIPYGTAVDGYCFAVSDHPAGVVDEVLPAAGVPTNDFFYIVIAGPTKFTNQHASAIATAVGSKLVPAATGSSLTDDLAGRVALQDLTGATATLGNNIQHVVGYAGVVDSTIDDQFVGIARFPLRGGGG